MEIIGEGIVTEEKVKIVLYRGNKMNIGGLGLIGFYILTPRALKAASLITSTGGFMPVHISKLLAP